MAPGVTVWGSGTPVVSPYNGATYGGTVAPTVDGDSRGPTFVMASHTTLTGVDVENTFRPQNFVAGLLDPNMYVTVPGGGATFYLGRVGIYGVGTDITVNNVSVSQCSYGGLFVAPSWRPGSYDLAISDSKPAPSRRRSTSISTTTRIR